MTCHTKREQSQGGSFESGFLSAGLSQAVGQYMDAHGLGYAKDAQGMDIAYNAGVAAVVGGTISSVSGGSFESGALNAAMGRLFNDLSHQTVTMITRTFTAIGAGAGGAIGAVGGGAVAGVVSGGTLAIPAGALCAIEGAGYGAALGYVVAKASIFAVDSLEHLLSSSEGMLGENGVQTTSKTIWKGQGKERLDVENPNPGQRPGQIHYQDNSNNKYIYDPSSNSFPNAPKSVNEMLNNDRFKVGIEKGMKYLGR